MRFKLWLLCMCQKQKLNYTQFVGKYAISVRVANLILSHFQAK